MHDQPQTIEELAKVIYEAKKENAWGKHKSEYREEWPADKKELRKRLHHGDCGLEFAFAQAKAVVRYLNRGPLIIRQEAADQNRKTKCRGVF